MDELLTIAHWSLWLCIAVLAALVGVLRLQIAGLFGRIAPAGALMVNALLKVGQAAPRLTVSSLAGRPFSVGGPSPRSQLLLFVSPDCPISRSLLPAVRSLPRTETWLDTVLCSDGDEVAVHRAFVQDENLDALPYLHSEALGRAFGVSKLPYGVLIDEDGSIAAMGIVNSREHLESLFEAKERKIASVQDYLKEYR
ncbi:MAG: hypothetical protein KDI31_04825 [Pseudomonadales bacterium]|nr:hypothetical protein [Pseudomonadales bacterium]